MHCSCVRSRLWSEDFFPFPLDSQHSALTAVGLPYIFSITCNPTGWAQPPQMLYASWAHFTTTAEVTLSSGFEHRGVIKRPRAADKSESCTQQEPIYRWFRVLRLTRLMRMKISLWNLSSRIKFHLSHSRVMAVSYRTAEGSHNECFGIDVIKKTKRKCCVISDFVWLSHL